MRLQYRLALIVLLGLPVGARADVITFSVDRSGTKAFAFDDARADFLNERQVVATGPNLVITFSFLTEAPSFATSTGGIFPDSFRITTSTDLNLDGSDDELLFADNTAGAIFNGYGDFRLAQLSVSLLDNLGASAPYRASGSFRIAGLPPVSPVTVYFTLLNDDPGFNSRVEASVTSNVVPEPATLVLAGAGIAGLGLVRRSRTKRA